ncbi:MAG TPA: DUF4091 domain-containing protein [Candidatus Hydrogenedentes bacterium]|nr:DUF4091 domain-containing protein [Candidatus Hydrogenedentota bacterium]HPG68974.1 DUF4091 domain-containing protein [Candidatus Hydrogenedentota bacterium]
MRGFSLVLSVATAILGAASALAWDVVWTYDLEAPAAAPTLYPNAETPSGLIVVAGANVIRLDGFGAAVWSVDLPSVAATPATVSDLDGDGTAEVLIALEDGPAVCLDERGQERWRCALAGPAGGFKMITAADVLPDAGLELLFGYDDGWLNCLSARGELIWRFSGDRFRVGPVAVGDVDGDLEPEIVFGTDNGHVYCLTSAGRIQWRYWEMAPYGRSGPNLADLDGDGSVEVLITRSNVGNATCLMALDGATGALKWRTQDVMQGYCSNAIADLDGNGSLEVIHGDKGNWIYCVYADGTERWRKELGGRGVFWAPAVADIDGDGQLEITVAARGVDPADNACVFVLEPSGEVQDRLALGSDANAAPAIGDINGDGNLEVILAVQGPNRIHVLSWGGGGPVAWASARGDSAMNARSGIALGSAVRPARLPEMGGLQVAPKLALWGENNWPVSWDTPAAEETGIELAVDPTGGPAEITVVPVDAGAQGVRVPWQLSRPGLTALTFRMFVSGQPDPLLVAYQEVQPEPATFCDIRKVQEACGAARQESAKIGEDVSGIEFALTSLRVDQETLQRRLDAGEAGIAIAARASMLREDARALLAFARAVARFRTEGGRGSFVVWPDKNPWHTFYDKMAARDFPLEPTVEVSAYGDEYEDTVITIFNITGRPLDIRCAFAPPRLTQGPPEPEPELAKHVTLRRAVRTPSQFGEMVNDALPELDASRTVTVPAYAMRQLWLVADTHGLEPGAHTLTLYLGSLEQAPTIRAVPITINVWPIRLPEGVFAKMNWARIDAGDISDEQVGDMIAHGNSVSYGPALPSVPLDATGGPAGDIDWSHVDATLARVPGYWQVLFPGPPDPKWPEGVSPQKNSPVWQEGFKTTVRALAQHLNAIGWAYDRWAFYPVDEPWNTGETLIPQLRGFCTLVKAADPKVRNYTDPAGNVRVEKIAEFRDLIDIWQPEMNLLKRDPRLLEWFRQNAKVFWAYEATGPGKDLRPLGYYRANGWLAWKFGLDGAGYWCYKGNDIWWPVRGGDWSVVYQTGDEVVPSRRWEASRDGVEDYRALHALNVAIERAKTEGKADVAEAAQALMDEAVENLVGRQGQLVDEITRQTRDYEIDFALLSDYRVRIKDEILKLRATAAATP